ncbi:MAG: flagellar assembly peptidoglycan hydrolase FlgJ [Thiopseudomonas sp.]|nr:flagellar assembly peptidoglycan hydrolase FlgJ [Thiopseudomonas sp.]MCK9465315.1 flagellar assembly peptidoglycan hydrolase FlgJ [Thiopseudomonas sp.]
MDLHRTHTQSTASYTDLNRLHKLKVGEDRDSEANIRQVAQEFESLFIGEMLKAMRSANDVLADDSIFNSNESKAYRDMHDQQLSVTMAQGRGIGMADVLVRQMSEMHSPRAGSNPFPGMQGAAASAKNDIQPEQDEQIEQIEAQATFRRTAIQTPVMPQYAVNGMNTADERMSTKHKAAVHSYAAVSKQNAAQTIKPTGNNEVFNSPQEFISAMMPMAQQAAEQLGVEPRYLVAQAALETGWGKNMLRDAQGGNTFNLFGIKAHGWKGQSAQATTSEFVKGEKVKEQADFRQYSSFEQSFNDYVSFLQSNGRYKEALKVADNPEQYLRELQRAGYATDPQYAQKISRIAQQMQDFQQTARAPTPRIAERG